MYSNENRVDTIKKKSLQRRLAGLAFETGLVQLGRPLWSNWLTVVNYHRIDDVTQPDFDSFKPNVSASPAEFERQMEYLTKWYNVVSVKELIGWLNGEKELPPHAALITFDDGYLDNYTNAFPILRQHGLPALIFLATGHIGTDVPFYWDLAAYCFHHTAKDHISFPHGRDAHWADHDELDTVSKDWTEALKALPEPEKQSWVERLPEILQVSIPEGYFQGLMMDWDQAREMSAGGIEFGGHTLSHPILTRISFEEAKSQIAGSRRRVQAETDQEVLGFAYPNGMMTDLNRGIEGLVAEAGYRVAFTLLHGPSPRKEVRSNPFAIRRIFISHKHSMQEFAAMLSPLNRLRD